ncbi:MAG: Tad domain-containing protein [Clostridia bacterium]|nr:Tad domain-containing protein [Clostridia bacterium]
MMGFFSKTQGAVSIFLVIVLLPMLCFAGVFVDLGRIKLAEETVTTAADLALNTVLSKYDNDLKDYYGLFASAQNNDDVITLAQQYFKEALISGDFTTSELDEYGKNIVSAVMVGGEISDMLRLTVEGDITISSVKNGAMNNPALIKEGIVEFMKYRAPVNGVAKLFDDIKESNVSEVVEDASYESEMIEKKKEFYEAEEDLFEQAEKAYDAIKEYKNYVTWTGKRITDEEYLNELALFLMHPDTNDKNKSFEDVYKEAHTKLVKNLYNTHNDGGDLINFIKVKYFSTYTSSTYSSNKTADSATIENLLDAYNEAHKNYVSKRTNLNTAWNKVGELKSTDYPIQYWVTLTTNCRTAYNDYVNVANVLRKATTNLENAIQYASEGAMETKVGINTYSNSNVTYPTAGADGKLTLQEISDTLLDSSVSTEANGSGCPSYSKINSQINGVNTTANNDKMKTSTVSNIFNIRNSINKYITDFEKAAALAKKAKGEVNKLKTKLKTYKDAFDDWNEAANVSELDSSDLAAKDRAEIQKLKDTGIEHFSEESVTELVTRLDNIQIVLETFQEDLEAIKYNGTPIVNISNFSKFKSVAKLSASKIVKNNSLLNEYVNSSFKFSIGKQIQRVIINTNKASGNFDNGEEYLITRANHLNIELTELELLTWMKKTFDGNKLGPSLNESDHGFDVSNEDGADSARDEIGDKSESTDGVETSENLKGKSFSDWNGAKLPSKGYDMEVDNTSLSADVSDVSDFATDIFSNFGDKFMKSLTAIRDDLFMLDYTFSMFTHDTFENEIYYELSDEKDGMTSTNASGRYTTVKNSKKAQIDEMIKTLTLNARNTKNNWAYGGEVEYILYGNASSALNKTAAYSQIYLIRYALNLAPVFDLYYDNAVVRMVASALEIFAHIPQGVTKTLICLAITAAEAGVEISYLRWGIPVQLIKTEDDLICNYENIFSNGKENKVVNDGNLELQYSDYLKIFMFIKLLGKGENDLYLRTADVIQANISQSTSNFEFALSKSIVYYTITANVVMEPMWTRLLAMDDLGDLSSQKGWRTINIEMTRGY